MLLKESKEDLNKWREITYCWIRGLNIVKMAVFSILIYRVNAMLTNIPADFFVEEANPKIYMEMTKQF